MSYGAQTYNGAYKPHNVTFATFAEGNRIEGKLSDWKKEYEALLSGGNSMTRKGVAERYKHYLKNVNFETWQKRFDAAMELNGLTGEYQRKDTAVKITINGNVQYRTWQYFTDMVREMEKQKCERALRSYRYISAKTQNSLRILFED